MTVIEHIKSSYLEYFNTFICIALAAYFHWTSVDLVWTIWLGSLVSSTLTVILVSLNKFKVLYYFQREKYALCFEFGLWTFIVILLACQAIALAHTFFTFPLSHFFPIDNHQGLAIDFSFLTTFWHTVFLTFFNEYWTFVIAVLLGQRKLYLQILSGQLTMKNEYSGRVMEATWGYTIGQSLIAISKMPFFIIFVLAATDALEIEGVALYAIVYIFFFFPFSIYLKQFCKKD